MRSAHCVASCVTSLLLATNSSRRCQNVSAFNKNLSPVHSIIPLNCQVKLLCLPRSSVHGNNDKSRERQISPRASLCGRKLFLRTVRYCIIYHNTMSKGDLLEQPSLHEQEEYFRRILKELQLEGIVSVGKSKVCPGKGNYNYS
jgi:hypothetical protein